MDIEDIDTYSSSQIKLPSCIFILEKHELLFYERFSYSILDIGIEALHKANLPINVIIDYVGSESLQAPWSINASISASLSNTGSLIGFKLNIPTFLPFIIHIFSLIIDKGLIYDKTNKNSVKDELQLFFNILNESVKTYKEKDNNIVLAIRKGYELLKYSYKQINNSFNQFDLLSRLIANHEIAHAYIGQLSGWKRGDSIEAKAYEFIADLLSTQWIYNLMIVNTPKSEEYLKDRGLEKYSDAIYYNALSVLDAQLSLLVLFGVSSAMKNSGKVDLKSGISHPNSFFRHLMQDMHFGTLVLSNYRDELSEDQYNTINSTYLSNKNILLECGFISKTDIEYVKNKESLSIIEKTAEIIRDKEIKELYRLIDFFDNFKEIRTHF